MTNTTSMGKDIPAPLVDSVEAIAAEDTNEDFAFLTALSASVVALLFASLVSFILWDVVAGTISRSLHGSMFFCLMRAPMRFFDTNPIGRVMNRFSKDLGVVDELLPQTMRQFLTVHGMQT